MTSTPHEWDERLQKLFDHVRALPPLEAQAVAEERAKFLEQAKSLRMAVSRPAEPRHNKWIHNFILTLQRKERSSMLKTLMVMVLSVALVLGGTGGTVYAAQDSLPDELLYPVKTWSEDARLAWAGSPQAQLAMTLEFADRRMAEMAGLEADGKAIPGSVILRMENELEAALQIAAGMEDPQMMPALQQIRLQAEAQSQRMGTILNGDPDLVRLQERLQEQVRLVAEGSADPHAFRLVVGERQRNRQTNPGQTPHPTQLPGGTCTPMSTPQPTGGSDGPGPGAGQTTGTPGHYGPGEPHPSQTPMPTGGSYGPGPGSGQPSSTPGGYGPGAGTATCTPGSGAGPSHTPPAGGPGSGSQNPAATSQPGGPGSGDNQPTEQNEDPGSGQPPHVPGQGGGG